MNVFLPEQSVMDCVRALDDNRLMKQILEIKVLLNGGAGYAHHPVKVFYADKQDFLRHYGFSCCVEYYMRFGKIHKYADDFKTPFNADTIALMEVLTHESCGLAPCGAGNEVGDRRRQRPRFS
mgnify:CR=1 FL=1